VLYEAITLDYSLCWESLEMMNYHEGRKNLLLIIDHAKKEILENEERRNHWLEIKGIWLSDFLRHETGYLSAQHVQLLLDASLFSGEDIANYLQDQPVLLTPMLIIMDTCRKEKRGLRPDFAAKFDKRLMQKINLLEHSTLYSKCLWHSFRIIWGQRGHIEFAEFLSKLILPRRISEDLNNLSKLGQDINISSKYVYDEEDDWWLKW